MASISRYEIDIAKVFNAKAAVAHKLHCSSKVRIKRMTLVEWLEPTAFQSKKWQKDFLLALSEAKPWIYKGDSEKSRLIRELAWDGKMFGSFTQARVKALRRWIDSLATRRPDPEYYWEFTGRTKISSKSAVEAQDIRVNYPVLSSLRDLDMLFESSTVALDAPIFVESIPKVGRFLALWFAQSWVLEYLVTIPFRTADASTSAIIRVLRAQYGFALEGAGVDGIDEMRRVDYVDLHAIGLEMARKAGIPEPNALQDLLQGEDSIFAMSMLELSTKPLKYRDALLGMAWALMRLHEALSACVIFEFLSMESKAALANIAKRERSGLEICWQELKTDQVRKTTFCNGFCSVWHEIRSFFP